MPSAEPPQHALTERVDEVFRRWGGVDSGWLLIVSDFDGTLAPLVMDPWRATILPGAQRALRRLAAMSGTRLAFISGRATRDLAGRVRVGRASYHGDHGAEWGMAVRGFRPSALRLSHEPVDPEVLAVAERLKVEVPRRVREPWVVLEDKGPALAFHFRGAPDVDQARERIRAVIDELDSEARLERLGGRRYLELRPRGSATKRQTLARLIEQHRPEAVLMLGDDIHDAAAFGVLRAARVEGRSDALAIGVLSRASEAVALADHADVVLDGPVAAARLLARLVRARASGPGPR
jgi:trehalose 6-phosphate phosphatase